MASQLSLNAFDYKDLKLYNSPALCLNISQGSSWQRTSEASSACCLDGEKKNSAVSNLNFHTPTRCNTSPFPWRSETTLLSLCWSN